MLRYSRTLKITAEPRLRAYTLASAQIGNNITALWVNGFTVYGLTARVFVLLLSMDIS